MTKKSGIKAILTDIEGTTSSISFVKDVLFPYAFKHLPGFVEEFSDEVAPIRGRVVRFPARACGPCPKREACTRAAPPRGRSISIHPQEDLLQKLVNAKKTTNGRAALRERVSVEHGLAHICNRQGRRARYRGLRKNVFDLCRYAVIENLFVADRAERAAA